MNTAQNSLTRRLAKRVLAPLVPANLYAYPQALATFLDMHGRLAEPEMELIPYAVQHGDTVLDIGANYGVYTVACSRAVGRAGHVYAFEPIPRTLRALRLVARLAGCRNVTIVSYGCGAERESAEFVMPWQVSGAPMAGQAHRRGIHHRHAAETVERCQLVRVDDVVPFYEPIALIKCDIEGGELFAFQGARQILIRHHPTIICEINPTFLADFHLTVAALRDFLAGYGYRPYRYVAGYLHSVTLDEACEEDNYVFVHPSRQDRLAHLMG